jgi:hypothetical protein
MSGATRSSRHGRCVLLQVLGAGCASLDEKGGTCRLTQSGRCCGHCVVDTRACWLSGLLQALEDTWDSSDSSDDVK